MGVVAIECTIELLYGVVAIEKEAFGSPSIKVVNFTITYYTVMTTSNNLNFLYIV